MRIGIATPCVTYNPGNNNDWELDATVAELSEVVRAADRLGYHHLTCSEHIGYPAEHERVPGMARYFDPLASLSYFAALTERIRLQTHVLVLPYHHPLAVAKRYGTLDHLSGGRLILGVGVGHSPSEFELLGVPFADRNERTDDSLRALRAALGSRQPSYAGTHFRFDRLVIDPHALQERVPLWIGGHTMRSLRRAVELGDGWVPFGLDRDELGRMLQQARAAGILDARPDPFDLVLYVEPRVDPLGDPEGTAESVRRYQELGASVLTLRIVHHSPAHCLEQLEAMQALADALDPDDPMGSAYNATAARGDGPGRWPQAFT